ncbi:MAG: nicotinamide riboside transporter PnuC [Oscillospiraceae bacterium]
MKIRSLLNYFSKLEIILWCCSVGAILISFFMFDREKYMTLAASLVGVTSLIFCAKGNPFGQILMIIFSLLYGIISYNFAYYGEMVTYVGMTMPMAVISLVSWLKNPYNGNKSEVAVNRISAKETAFMCTLTAAVTAAFYFILRAFDTANIIPGTLSVTTSFIAVYLTFRRSTFFAAAYAANDVILIILWTLASFEDMQYIPVTVCFAAFLANDIYGFINWRAMEKRQMKNIVRGKG